MAFTVQLTPDLTPVEPGSTTPVSVVIVNRSDDHDRFEMEIEGVDSEWKAVPVPIFSVDPNETHTEKIFFKPRRDSESLAGNYPFVVKVRSLETGEQRTVQGVLQVKPFHHLTMEISPKKGFVSPGRKQNEFDVAIVNLGNTEHTLKLVGSDPEDSCAYEFEHEQITVSPGQQREVELVVNPTSQPLFSGGRLIGFSVTGRSIDAPSLVASSQAQLEQRSLFSPTSIIFAVIVIALLGAWVLMWPKPPTVDLSVDPLQAMQGDQVRVQWNAEHASRVIVKFGSDVVYDGPELRGARSVMASSSGSVEVSAVASKNGREQRDSAQIEVQVPAEVPKPEIVALAINPRQVNLGETFILQYRFSSSVSRAVLQPTGQELDLALNEFEVEPTRAGTSSYTVVAMNSKGESTRRTVSVNVVDASSARIPVFRASPTTVKEPDSRTTLDWLVTGAVRVILTYGSQEMPVENSGPMSFDISGATTFTLTAYDDKGRSIKRELKVEYEKQTVPPPDDTTSTATTTTGGATNSTTGGNTTTTSGSTASTAGGLR